MTASSSSAEPSGAGRPRAAILGCAGSTLSDGEAAFFADADPLGFILFARNCENPAQILDLTRALRAAVGRADAPVLIDQEGGRVARLKPPHWRVLPASAPIGALFRRDPALGREAARLRGRLAASDLAPLGITVSCSPVLDVLQPGAHATAIGDRAFGDDPAAVAALARAEMDGLLAGGVLPVVKHIPGHGRADADSHFGLPVVRAAAADLMASDVAAFRAVADAPLAMTAHLLYPAWDPARCATMSPTVVRDVIRGAIGFDGLLMSDDLSMKALGGDYAARAAGALAAGCDVVLHCNGDPAEMRAVMAATGPLSDEGLARWRRAAALLADRPQPAAFDADRGARRLAELLGS